MKRGEEEALSKREQRYSVPLELTWRFYLLSHSVYKSKLRSRPRGRGSVA